MVFVIIFDFSLHEILIKIITIKDRDEQVELVLQLLEKNYDLTKQTPFEIIQKLIQNSKQQDKNITTFDDNQLSQSQLNSQQLLYLDENLICSLSQTIAAKEKELAELQSTQNNVLQQKDIEIQELRRDLQLQKESVEKYEQQLSTATNKIFQLELSQDTQKRMKQSISQTKKWPMVSQNQVQTLKQYAYQLHCLSLTSCQSSSQFSSTSNDKLTKPQIDLQESKIKALELSQNQLKNAVENYQRQIKELQDEVIESNKKMVHYMNLYNQVKYQ